MKTGWIFVLILLILVFIYFYSQRKDTQKVEDSEKDTQKVEDLEKDLEKKKKDLEKIFLSLDNYNLNKKYNNKIDIPTYYINLKRSKDRKINLLKQFETFSPKTILNRVNAIDGNLITDNHYVDPYGVRKQYHMNVGNSKYEKACSMSHLYAIKNAYENGDEYALILEDDVSLELSHMWPYSLSELIKIKPKDCEIIQLFSFGHKYEKDKLFIKRDEFKASCIAYIISRKAMKYHMNTFTDYGMKYRDESPTADDYIYNIPYSIYLTNNWIFQSRQNISTIHIEHEIIHVHDTLINCIPFWVFNVKLEGYFDDFTKLLIERAVNKPVVYNIESLPINLYVKDALKSCQNDTENFITWSGESCRCHNKNSLFNIITSKPEYKNDIYVSYMVRVTSSDILDRIYNKTFKKMSERPYLLAYINSNCTDKRDKLFTEILKRSTPEIVHSLGKCLNNHKQIGGTWENNSDNLENYRFIIAMENKDEEMYITEKIINAYSNGAIPIYSGGKNTAELYFTKGSYIDVNDFDSLEECAEFIINLNKNIDKLQEIQNMDVIYNKDAFKLDFYESEVEFIRNKFQKAGLI
jgi:hypothetical protein